MCAAAPAGGSRDGFEAADADDPGEAAGERDEGDDSQGRVEAAGPVDEETGQGRSDDAGDVGDAVLEADPPAGGT